MKQKIGLGVITCNRPNGLRRVLASIPMEKIYCLVIVNDGRPIPPKEINTLGLVSSQIIQNDANLGVGKSKNKVFRRLLAEEVDHLFLMEDDIYIKKTEVFDSYIKAATTTGISHFNYSQHGNNNKKANGDPDPVAIIRYGILPVPLYRHCVGAFSYYTRSCLESVGYFDEEFFNAGDHVEHTYRTIKNAFHPDFWHFADIAESAAYLGDDVWSTDQSEISRNDPKMNLFEKADLIFHKKHGVHFWEIPVESPSKVMQSLERMRTARGICKEPCQGLCQKWHQYKNPQSSRRSFLKKIQDRCSKMYEKVLKSP